MSDQTKSLPELIEEAKVICDTPIESPTPEQIAEKRKARRLLDLVHSGKPVPADY